MFFFSYTEKKNAQTQKNLSESFVVDFQQTVIHSTFLYPPGDLLDEILSVD